MLQALISYPALSQGPDAPGRAWPPSTAARYDGGAMLCPSPRCPSASWHDQAVASISPALCEICSPLEACKRGGSISWSRRRGKHVIILAVI